MSTREECVSTVINAIERGLLFIRSMNSMDGEGSEVCMRVADKLVQWAFAIMSIIEDGDAIFESVVSVRQSIIHYMEHTLRSSRGRPGIRILETQLIFYLENGFTISKISNLFGCSRRTIERRMHEYGLSARQIYSSISDSELNDKIVVIIRHNPALGEKSVDGLLRANGIIVQRQRIRNAMWASDPEGIQFRLRHCLRRREYHVEAPNSLWHIDGYHKLIRWKLVVHGGIDGYSRLIMYLRVANNNRSDTALAAFQHGIRQYGLPLRVRTDRGGENVLIGEYML